MESAAGKSVQLRGGPIGYVYAVPKTWLSSEEVGLLAAKSGDSDSAVLPLVAGLTVETGFVSNVAAVAGVRTTGLGGSGVTVKLVPTHYNPCAFVFHGGDAVRPSTMAPNLTKACETARAKFGYSPYSPLADESAETKGDKICDVLDLDPTSTALFLITTELFREAVYLCNAYLHYGGRDKVTVGEVEATRVPLYPLHVALPDFNRVNIEPFNDKHRSLGEGSVMPRAFYNDKLCRLLHGYILGPTAVALRVRNLDAVARGAAHLCFDENHEGVLLPNDVTFTAFETAQDKNGGGGSGFRGGAAGRGASGRRDGYDNGGGSSSSGFERRTASLMASDATLSIESMISASVYDDGVQDVRNWPLMEGRCEGTKTAEALGAYMARVAGLVGAMAFSSNSAIYMTEVDDAGSPDGKEGNAPPSFYRFYQFAAPHLAANPQTDREGRVLSSTRDRQSAPINGVNQEFTLDFLALACGFCPQLLARMLFYLERCDAGAAAYRHDADAAKYVANSIDSDLACELCDKTQRPHCAQTTVYRLRHRLPRFGNPSRGSIGLFGAMTNNYSDTDPLGSYAPFSSLKRTEGEAPRSVMQDTYRVTVERVMTELEKAGVLARGDPADVEPADAVIRDARSFIQTMNTVKQTAEREAAQLMHNLVENRDYKIREGLGEANHTLSIAIEPYSAGLCPLLAFLSRRSMLTVIQDMALSQCSVVMHGQQVEARNFRTQFQAVLRRRVLDMQNAGFLTSRNVTVTLADQTMAAPDSTKSQMEPPSEADGDLVRVNVEVFRELKVKNRVMFFGASATGSSEAARARMAGMAEAFQRPERRVDVLNGALGFAVKRFHANLFPKGGPQNGMSPNAQWFWSMLQRNQMPARMLNREDIETITYIKRYTDEYAAINYINAAPSCVGELAQFYLANIILKYCDHRHYFISSVAALTSTARRPKDASSVLQWLRGPIGCGADVERSARDFLGSLDSHPEAWTSTFSSTSLVRFSMNSRPLVVLGLSISKYQGTAGSARVFQAGNWGNLSGGKNVCPLMTFDRTRRYIMVCPRVGFVAENANTFTAGAKEKTLSEQARLIIAEGGAAPHVGIYLAALKSMGAHVRDMQLDDWTAVTEDNYIASLLCELNGKVEACGGGWSVEAATAVAREAEAAAASAADNDGGVTFDFDACADDAQPSAGFGAGFGGGHAAVSAQTAQQETLKRHAADGLFDLGPAPEKKPSLSIDML
uniref:SsDNA-binding protein n=1 Tax=Anatid alphaherpesvirus 2 TaxID=3080522 RepID=A0AAU0K887_9ALPH